ncbi:MAG: NADH:ubiquinone reductase (Na(+)-transporting) subunit F, partial [Candidatus Neomarinimicrobiota bacterium]
MVTAITGVIVFTVVILILVLLLNLAEKKLLPQGDVEILINDDKEKSVKVRPGSTLLSALAGHKIFIPSA